MTSERPPPTTGAFVAFDAGDLALALGLLLEADEATDARLGVFEAVGILASGAEGSGDLVDLRATVSSYLVGRRSGQDAEGLAAWRRRGW
jgi:hypothetical protein